MGRVLVFVIFFSLWSFGKYLTFEEIHKMPKGVAKNYYIWRFISQKSTTKEQAKKIIKEATRINYLLKKAYIKKTGLKPPKVSGALRYSRNTHKIPKKVDKNTKRKREITKKILSSPNPVLAWQAQPPSIQIFSFNYGGRAGRKKLDHTPTISNWQNLTKHWGIDRFIRILRKENLPKFRKVLFYPPAEDAKIGYKNLMWMGFLNLQRGNTKVAELDFALAVSKARVREDADRALFWAWKARGNRVYLKRLSKSYSINIYTLAARDALGMKYDLGITPKLPKKKINFDIKDPVEWIELKKKIFSKKTNLLALASHFKSEESVGIYSYIMTKASRDKDQYFPMPYREYLSKFPIKRQAIIYAIARQESKFIPASISASYALGMMQIMPFLVRHLAKKQKELVDYDDMFNPRIALKYGNKHLDYLTKWLQHPLFVAYAYNAGIGYTRKLITKGDLFVKKNRYEPWLSIEKVPNLQANEYGKRVLANYVIYLNKLGYQIRITDLVNSLTNINITDKFRIRKFKKR